MVIKMRTVGLSTGVLTILAQVRSQFLNLTGNLGAGNPGQLIQLPLQSARPAATEVAFALLGTHNNAAACHPETLRRRFMGLLLIFLQLGHNLAPKLLLLVGRWREHHQHGIAFHERLLFDHRDVL